MIKKYSLALLEKALNQALSLDANMASHIIPLNGKIIEIIIAPLEVNFFISFQDEAVLLSEKALFPAHTIIRSTPLGLIRLSLLPTSQARSLFNDTVQIRGDVELGEKIKQIFNSLDIDWEGHLARFTGDVVAYQIGSCIKQSLSFKQRIAQSFKHNFREYTQEELRLCPAREELHDFFHDIDHLSMDIERLQAKINWLAENDTDL